jgi:hypothetical protein
MSELDQATTQAISTIGHALAKALSEKYPEEPAEAISNTVGLLLHGGHVGLSADGRLRYSSAVASIAPRLCVQLTKGTSEAARLARSVEKMRLMARLPRAQIVESVAAKEAIANIPFGHTMEQKLQRAADVTAILLAAGHTEENADGD